MKKRVSRFREAIKLLTELMFWQLSSFLFRVADKFIDAAAWAKNKASKIRRA